MSNLDFTNARLFDGEGFSEPTTLKVREGRIVSDAHGIEADEVVDLDGKYVLPGFVESHAHPMALGQQLLGLDIVPASVEGVEDICKLVEERAATAQEGEWIVGSGWDENYFKEGRTITRDDLDKVAPDTPVALTRTCVHMMVVNTAALKASGLDEDVQDPNGGRFVRDDNGRFTGLVQEAGMDMIKVAKPTKEDYRKALQLAQDELLSYGITTVHDLSTFGTSIQAYTNANRNETLRVRFRLWLWALHQAGWVGLLDEVLNMGIGSGFGDDKLRVEGVKFTLDGSVSGKTAAMLENFCCSHDNGLMYLSDEEIKEGIQRALEGELRVAVHGIGERAIEQAIRAYEDYGDDELVRAGRNRIEHCTFPSAEQLERMKKLNLTAASSIGFVYHLGDGYISAIGKERAAACYPHKTFAEHGINAPGNSDAPVTTASPWHGIYGAVARKSKTGADLGQDESISLAAAIKAFTTDAAFTSFEEDVLGTLGEGAYADIQVLDVNPFEVEQLEDLVDIKPSQVYIGGVREV